MYYVLCTYLLCRYDVLEYLSGVVGLEGGAGEVELVDQTAQGPIVYSLVVPLRHHDLRGEVLRCAAQRVGLVLSYAVLCVCVCVCVWVYGCMGVWVYGLWCDDNLKFITYNLQPTLP
jgi:hypothetical protein